MNSLTGTKHVVIFQGAYESLAKTKFGIHTIHVGTHRDFRHIVTQIPGVTHLTIMLSAFFITSGLRSLISQIRYLNFNRPFLNIALVTPVAMKEGSLKFLRKRELALMRAVQNCSNVLVHRTGDVQMAAPVNMYARGIWKGLEYISRSLFDMGIPVSLKNSPSTRFIKSKTNTGSKTGPRKFLQNPRFIHFQKGPLTVAQSNEPHQPMECLDSQKAPDSPPQNSNESLIQIKQEPLEDEDYCQIIDVKDFKQEPEMIVVDPPSNHSDKEQDMDSLSHFDLKEMDSFLQEHPIDLAEYLEETDEVKMFLDKPDEMFLDE